MNNILILSLLLTALCCHCEARFLHQRDAGRHWPAFFLKGLASLSFVAVGLVMALYAHRGGAVVWGLVFGLAGDGLLALRKIFPAHHDLTFVSGALAFSVGHFCYMAALLGAEDGLLLPALPLFLLLTAGSEVFAHKAGFSSGSMHWPGLLYIAIEAAMCALALVRLFLAPSLAAGLFAAGGVSFLVSDNLLCAYSFGSMKTSSVDRWLHLTYIAAQLLIAWSIAA